MEMSKKDFEYSLPLPDVSSAMLDHLRLSLSLVLPLSLSKNLCHTTQSRCFSVRSNSLSNESESTLEVVVALNGEQEEGSGIN